jgi:hypothetical protein
MDVMVEKGIAYRSYQRSTFENPRKRLDDKVKMYIREMDY